MRVLVACEFSGIVRDAFIARGHDAVSCDLLPIYVGVRKSSGKRKARYETDCAGRIVNEQQRRWYTTEAMSCATDDERRH